MPQIAREDFMDYVLKRLQADRAVEEEIFDTSRPVMVIGRTPGGDLIIDGDDEGELFSTPAWYRDSDD